MMRTLPDLLRPGLALVFIGINPGERSARTRHYYAHPGNAFWRELAASDLVAEDALAPSDDRRLLEAGIGFTDAVKRVVTDSSEITRAELAAAVPALRARIAYASPSAVCFTSTRALEAALPRTRVAGHWGCQPATFEGAAVWLIPSTSGRAAAYRGEISRVLGALALELGGTTARRRAA